MKIAALIVGLAGILVALSFVVVRYWFDVDAGGYAEVSTAGIYAMIGGIILTLLLGVGLMVLVFYSSRKGYDELQKSSDKDDQV